MNLMKMFSFTCSMLFVIPCIYGEVSDNYSQKPEKLYFYQASSNEPRSVKNERRPRAQSFSCKDKTAQILHKAGFRGQSHKMAWAITYRESKHQNLDESSRHFTGALGFWQVQTSAHSNNGWWSREAMLNPLEQSKIVYKYMSNKGTNWVPWGLNRDGSLNTTNYGGWSSWQHENWIMKNFRVGLSKYPC